MTREFARLLAAHHGREIKKPMEGKKGEVLSLERGTMRWFAFRSRVDRTQFRMVADEQRDMVLKEFPEGMFLESVRLFH
jgi:hypothetical protein